MPVIKVSVKWNGKKFDDVDLNTDEPGLVFKTQLFTLTGVAPDRQKIMIKGGLLKDETDLDKLKLKSGHTFMMMGTADELPKAPEKPIVFMEDMTDTQLAEVMDIPSGLQNLGNTCYMNATLQCFRAIPELQTELTKTGNMGTDGTGMLASSLRDLFKQLKETTEGVPPLVFLQIFRNLYPQFAQQTQGMYSQQDAEECWGNLLTTLKAKLIPTAEGAGFVEKYMCGEFQSTLTCDDAQDETPVVANEMFTKLKCHINITINYMMNGIKEALDEKIEKNSPSLNRSAMYTKKSRVSRLPRYLTVDFVRFFWKPQERVKAKILRKVKFPMELDASEVCTVELQEKMGPAKQRILALAEEKANAKRAAKVSKNRAADEDVTMGDAPPLGGGAVDGPVAVQKAPETPTLSGASAAFQDALNKKALDRKKPLSEIIHPDLQADAGCNPSGQYELCAVLTHIGRSADSGHYMAWVKKDEDEWFKFDDDKVSIVKADEVTKLDGGGDWHMAYICLYRAKELE